MRSYNDLNMDYKGGNIDIRWHHLQSLVGCPEHITGAFACYGNKLTSLVGGPQKVDRSYNCTSNKLTDLVGCASHIIGILDCRGNNITSLVGIHKIIKSCNEFYFDYLLITQGGISLLLISNLTDISFDLTYLLQEPFQIIKKYLGSGTKGMMACRAELIKKGYDEYAKL